MKFKSFLIEASYDQVAKEFLMNYDGTNYAFGSPILVYYKGSINLEISPKTNSWTLLHGKNVLGKGKDETSLKAFLHDAKNDFLFGLPFRAPSKVRSRSRSRSTRSARSGRPLVLSSR